MEFGIGMIQDILLLELQSSQLKPLLVLTLHGRIVITLIGYLQQTVG